MLAFVVKYTLYAYRHVVGLYGADDLIAEKSPLEGADILEVDDSSAIR